MIRLVQLVYRHINQVLDQFNDLIQVELVFRHINQVLDQFNDLIQVEFYTAFQQYRFYYKQARRFSLNIFFYCVNIQNAN